MPEQLDPPAADVATPPAAAGTCPAGSARELVDRAPEEVGEAVAANEKAWQAALRAKAKGDTEVARRVRAAGLIGGGPMDGSARDPFWNREDVLMCSPVEMEIVHDFNWAYEQRARGAFDAYAGECLAIVNKAVLAVGRDLNRMIAEAAAKAGVEEDRVAIFHVEVVEF